MFWKRGTIEKVDRLRIGNSLSLVVMRHDAHLADRLSSFVESVRLQVEEGHLGLADIVSRDSSGNESAEGPVRVSLVVRFSADGSLCEGKPPLGIIRVRGVPYYVIMTSLRSGGYLLAGRPFEEKLFLEDMVRNLPGMGVKAVRSPARSVLSDAFAGSAPLVRLLTGPREDGRQDDHLAFAMIDVLGAPVSVISITGRATTSWRSWRRPSTACSRRYRRASSRSPTSSRVTGRSSTGFPDAIVAFDHPYDAFLAKPYTMSELRRALGSACGKACAPQASVS